MVSDKMISQLVSINQRYKTSIKIDSQRIDFKNFIDDFVLHGTAINILDTISRDYSGSAQRAYTLTGPYGSGKSTIALFLSSLLSNNKKERVYANQKIGSSLGSLNDFSTRFVVKKGWHVIKHVCGLESPANAILMSTYKAFNIDFDLNEVKLLSDDECLSEIKKTITKKNSKSDGVLLLLDEMGKALDYQSRANKDLHLFQSLADIAQQSETEVLLIGFLHQAFTDYAKNKDSVAQKDWAKVQGRYVDLSFNPSIDESLILVGDSIQKAIEITDPLESKYKELIIDVVSTFAHQSRNSIALIKTLPLDPLVSLLLGPISRRRFSQNERSIFGFLSSHEKFGFRAFLAENYTVNVASYQLYSPTNLWDYLHHNLHHLIVTSNDSKAWLEGCDAIYRASQKGADLHVAIIKLIALFTIFGFHHHLHAKREFVIRYFSKLSHEKGEIEQALFDLEAWTVIIYRQKHDALFVFQGSDIDIHTLVLERIEAVSEGVDWTSVCENTQNILATAHYHRTGTMRWANTRLISKVDAVLLQSLKEVPVTGESFLSYLLPANANVEKELLKSGVDLPYASIGKVLSLENLKSVAIELIALEQIAKEEKKINHDLIAKNELKNRTVLAKQNVLKELEIAFKQASWTYEGIVLKSQPLSVSASEIADEIYYKAPEVLNELVNRSKPSGSANSAIRKLMERMLNHGDERDLGFSDDSFPPEKGIYLSCLKSKGWHCETEEGFTFPRSWSGMPSSIGNNMRSLWEDGVEFIKSSNDMITMAELYERWMRPPFGLTAGLCKIYGLALLKSLEGQVAFYDLDSTKQFIFIPELDIELVTKIYKHPAEAGVRYFKISEIQTHLLDTLAAATIGNRVTDDTILGIAKHIVKIVHTLPAWVKKTSGEGFSKETDQGLTNEARAFRNKVISANDPYKLILEDLPSIFGIDLNDKDADTKLAYRLKTAIEDLSAQHDMLLSGFKAIILTSLSAEFDIDLKNRCQQVVSMAQRPNVKELALRIIKYIDNPSKFEIIITLAAGTPEKNWTDKHLRNGLDELQNLCIQFRRIESFGNISQQQFSKPLAFITTDSEGNYKEYSSFIKHDLEDDNEVILAANDIQTSISNISKEKQIATLSHLLSNLMEEAEASDD